MLDQFHAQKQRRCQNRQLKKRVILVFHLSLKIKKFLSITSQPTKSKNASIYKMYIIIACFHDCL
jgi:hypothetical protein